MNRNHKKLLRLTRRRANEYWRKLSRGLIVGDDSIAIRRMLKAANRYERANWRLYVARFGQVCRFLYK